jgi:hypothetical protein
MGFFTDKCPGFVGEFSREIEAKNPALREVSTAPQPGLEPGTFQLTADCSAIELLWNNIEKYSKHNVLSQAWLC